MVCDHLSNAFLYYGLGKRFEAALRYLQTTDISSMEVGKYDILPGEVTLSVQRYTTQAETKLEGHIKFADIQYVAMGSEQIGYHNQKDKLLPTTSEYDPEKDLVFFDGSGIPIRLEKGFFMILWPDDIHGPKRIAETPEEIVKAVVKVLL